MVLAQQDVFTKACRGLKAVPVAADATAPEPKADERLDPTFERTVAQVEYRVYFDCVAEAALHFTLKKAKFALELQPELAAVCKPIVAD